jgi:uncharacterized membrane protein YsdA (DUF1294 family)
MPNQDASNVNFNKVNMVYGVFNASIVSHHKDHKTPMKVMHFFCMMLVLVYVPCCASIVKQQKIKP